MGIFFVNLLTDSKSSIAIAIVSMPLFLCANSFSSGISSRHGAHHVAQKFINNHFPSKSEKEVCPPALFIISDLNNVSV